MNEKLYTYSLLAVCLLFTAFFIIVVIPPLIENPDIIAAFSAGFVNPYSSGYSADVLSCWLILLIWVIYESPKIKYGWICLMLGIVPGVAVGFALYLILRSRQLASD
ncbi:MAG: DUF2834 domain-containing protein [Bacteroidia bacterium]|nr:DUF2834 domain-containing protein [Bacteroidia bacterium]